MKYFNVNGLLCKAESRHDAYMKCAEHSYETHNENGDFSDILSPDMYSNNVTEIDTVISDNNFRCIAEKVADNYNSKIEESIDGWVVPIAQTPNTSADLMYGEVCDMIDEKNITFIISLKKNGGITDDRFYVLDTFDSIDAIMSWVEDKVNEYMQTDEYKNDEDSRNRILLNLKEDIFKINNGWVSVVDKLPKDDKIVCYAYGTKITKNERNKINETPLFAFAKYDKKTNKWVILSEGITKNPFDSKKEETINCITHWCKSTHKIEEFSATAGG